MTKRVRQEDVCQSPQQGLEQQGDEAVQEKKIPRQRNSWLAFASAVALLFSLGLAQQHHATAGRQNDVIRNLESELEMLKMRERQFFQEQNASSKVSASLAEQLDRFVSVHESGPARVQIYDGLLTMEECEIFKATFIPPMMEAAGGAYDSYRSAKLAYPPTDGRILRVWDRVLKLTLSSQTQPRPLMQFAWTTSEHTKKNVHHDTNTQPARTITALIYLNDFEEGQGGETIFPCFSHNASSFSSSSLTPSARKACQTLIRGFEQNKRVLIANEQNDWAPKTREMLFETCNTERDDSAEAHGMLRVHPKCGRAVVFPSAYGDGTPVPQTWHIGCPPKAGVKYAIQFFREAPAEWEKKQWRSKLMKTDNEVASKS